MKTAAFIPIKRNSVRVPGKNFRTFDGCPLYQHIIRHAIKAACFDEVVVDTDSPEIAGFAAGHGCTVLERLPELTTDSANGNDLMVHHLKARPEFDLYFQLFATAPRLTPATIRAAVEMLTNSATFDSIMTVTREPGWFWFRDLPVNFRPGILPRSQDAPMVVKESTGLYGITRAALERYRCRIGARCYMLEIDPSEAVDIDYERDFASSKSAI